MNASLVFLDWTGGVADWQEGSQGGRELLLFQDGGGEVVREFLLEQELHQTLGLHHTPPHECVRWCVAPCACAACRVVCVCCVLCVMMMMIVLGGERTRVMV